MPSAEWRRVASVIRMERPAYREVGWALVHLRNWLAVSCMGSFGDPGERVVGPRCARIRISVRILDSWYLCAAVCPSS